MFRAKVILTGVAAAAFMVAGVNSAVADVEVSGYLDMSVNSTDTDGMSNVDSAGLDRAEVRFKSELAEGLAIEAHVAGGSDEDFDLEQAHMTYALSDALSLVAGKYRSKLGWEAFHAPDLYQWSTSATLVYPGMVNGAGLTYTMGGFEIYGAALASAWDSTSTDTGESAFEGNIRFTQIENLTVFVGYATEEMAATEMTEETPAMASYDQALINVWASYMIGEITLAAEYNDVSDWGGVDNDGEGWLAMVAIPVNDQLGVTLRTSALSVDNAAGAAVTDIEKWTVAPTYSVNDNLGLVLEYNNSEDKTTGIESSQVALEAIVTF